MDIPCGGMENEFKLNLTNKGKDAMQADEIRRNENDKIRERSLKTITTKILKPGHKISRYCDA